jgi:hypothetical protein
MTGFTDRVSRGILNHITGKTAIFTMPTAYVGLFTAVGLDSGSGFTECSGGGYARVATAAADWNAAGLSAPSTITNANPLVFPIATAGWGTIIGFGLFDAASGGNLNAWDYFGNFGWLPTTVSSAAPAVFTQSAHNYGAGTDSVVFSTEYGGLAPTVSAGSLSGLLAVATAPTVDTFTVSGLTTSSSGEGMVRKVVQQVIPSGVQPSFAAGSLTFGSA